jgi:hypothetical protein
VRLTNQVQENTLKQPPFSHAAPTIAAGGSEKEQEFRIVINMLNINRAGT